MVLRRLETEGLERLIPWPWLWDLVFQLPSPMLHYYITTSILIELFSR